jgi:hypothetical protein
MFGYYEGSTKNPSQSLRNAIKDAETQTSMANVIDNLILRLDTTVDGKPLFYWAKQKSENARKLLLSRKHQEVSDEIKSLYLNLFGVNLNKTDNQNAIINDIISLMDYISGITGKTPEEIKEEVYQNARGYLKRIAEQIVKPLGEIRASNYKRVDGKTAYVFTLSSQAISTLQYFTEKFYKRPSFLDSPAFANNIFNKRLSKIYNYVNYDGVTGEYSDEGIRYKQETELDWFSRNFKYFFLAHNADQNEKSTYVQQFLTISNKPNIVGAEVDFLGNDEKITEAILEIIKQDTELGKLFEGNTVKYKSNNSFGLLVKRDDKITDEQYAKQILEKMKERASSLTDYLFNTESTGIDESRVKAMYEKLNLKEKPEEMTEEDYEKLKKDNISYLFFANFYINSHQLNQLVAGPEGFYKNEFDVIKRMSITFATGYKAFVSDKFGLPKHYRSLVAKDIKGILGNDFVKFQKIWGKDFDLTDAQGYMTPKRAAQLRRAYGKAFAFGSVIKPVHFEIDSDGIPRAVKYSCIELTDELCEMFPKLRQVRDMLEKAEIDELVFESAVKVGKPSKDKLVEPNEDGTLPDVDKNSESIITLQNENYRIQSNPEHDVTDEEVAFPTQLGYFFNFSLRNTELAKELFGAMEQLMDNGMHKLFSELGMKSRLSEKDPTTIDIQRKNILKKIAKSMSEERDQRQIEFLNNENLGINTPFLIKKAITSLASMFSKATVAIRIPGGGLVLQSAYGTTTYVNKDGETVSRDLKWRDADGYAEVVLPDFWKGQFKEGDAILFDTQLGFRIPSTELHSAIPIKVVGFYPNNKNVIIAPREIVYFHGSDYDVDKLYVMRRSTFEKDIFDKNGELLYKAGSMVGYKGKEIDFTFVEKIEDERSDLRERMGLAKSMANFKTVNELSRKMKDLTELRDLYYKNVIVESFIKVTTDKINEDLMMSPITMERFKGMGIEEESAFDLAAKLKGFSEDKPKVEDYSSLKEYNEAVDEWIDKRNDAIFTKRNLYDVEDQMMMHKDNFSGTKLTGVFANMAKVIAYYFQSTTDGQSPKLKEDYHIKLNGKVYDSFSYNEQIDEITVNYDKDGNPIKSKPLITETIDSLVNAAIDNVKEQILPVIGFTNNMGGAAVALVATGMPLKDVVRITLQPVSQIISSYKSYNRGYDAVKKDLITKYHGENVIPTESSIEDMMEKINKVNITSEKLEESAKNEKYDQTKEDIIFQLAVLLRVVNKAEKINKSINKGVVAYSILKQFPITFHEILSTMETIDEITGQSKEQEEETETSAPRSVFENVDPVALPHINKAFNILKTLKSKMEYIFFIYNPGIQAFAKDVLGTIKRNVGDDVIATEMFRTNKPNEELDNMANSVAQYFLSGLSYTTPEGIVINNNTLSEPEYKNKYGTYVGTDAFMNRFSDEIRELRKKHPKNKFLQKLYLNNSKKVWTFDVAKNMDQSDLIDYQLDFMQLSDEQGFSKIQYEFVKYSILTNGLRFGATNYSLILPAKIYEPLMKEYNSKFSELTNNPAMLKEFLERVKENFLLQYAMNNIDSIKYVKKDEFNKLDNKISITRQGKVNTFLKVYSDLYYLDPATLGSETLTYYKIANTENIKGYQYDSSILTGYYKIEKAFISSIPISKVSNVNSNTFKDIRTFNVGQKIRIVNFADVTRLNMMEGTIDSVEGPVNGKYEYTLKDVTPVVTVKTDLDIINSVEYKNLLLKGYLPEAAHHKILNNC